jgi:hypothetical protein
MKKKVVVYAIVTLMLFVCISASVKHANGTAVYLTNSPADGPGDCTGCHSISMAGTVIPQIQISASPAFGAGNTFVPGATYMISYTVTGYPKFGFDLEILNNTTAAATDAGTFANVSNCRITPAQDGGHPTNVSHSMAMWNATSCSFNWTAPSTGPAYLYTTALGADGDGGTMGDKPVSMSMVLSGAPLGMRGSRENRTDLNIFPNPASSDIHLTYTLVKQSLVTIALYDLQGQIVAGLFEGNLEAGAQQFEGRIPPTLTKGIYMLKLMIDGVAAHKLMVIR